jgi:amino acid transporter
MPFPSTSNNNMELQSRKDAKTADISSNQAGEDVPTYSPGDDSGSGDGTGLKTDNGLQRHLTNRQIQLIAIGGSIGTALFVSIGYGLIEGGPASLFLGFTIYACFLSLVNNCMAEMTIFMPVSGGFIRLGGKVSLRNRKVVYRH